MSGTYTKLLKMMPERPSTELKEWIEDHSVEIGIDTNICLFKRESVPLKPLDCESIAFLGLGLDEEKRTWGARCKCLACGEEFVTGWCSNSIRGIAMIDEYGNLFPGVPDAEDQSVIINSGQTFICPFCGEEVTLSHSSIYARGLTQRSLVTSVENIGKYTALVTWIVSKRIEGFYDSPIEIAPREAIVLLEKRKLLRLTHTGFGFWHNEYDLGEWKVRKRYEDPMQRYYYSEGYRKTGSEVYPILPEMAGTTGEKTGLAAYILQGGTFPNVYLICIIILLYLQKH